MESFDPFALLGLERRYGLSAGEIESAYLARSAKQHPDVRGSRSPDDGDKERRISELNRARQVLRDPEQRAVTLWRLLGGVDDKALPPTFLGEIMEVREEVEAARGDVAASARWEMWTEDQREQFEQRVGELFASAAAPDAGLLKRIKMELNAWRYIERLVEQLHD